MLVLGNSLLSLSADGRLVVWLIGDYEEPQVCVPSVFATQSPSITCSADNCKVLESLQGSDMATQLHLKCAFPTEISNAKRLFLTVSLVTFSCNFGPHDLQLAYVTRESDSTSCAVESNSAYCI